MAKQLYGTREEAAKALAGFTDEQLEFLIAYERGSAAYQEERLKRLDAIKARERS
jgi:hypothetical protein